MVAAGGVGQVFGQLLFCGVVVQGVVDAQLFPGVRRDGRQACCLSRFPLSGKAFHCLFPGREQQHPPFHDCLVPAVFVPLYFPGAINHAVGGLGDNVRAGLSDFVQHQQAVIAGSGGVAETVAGAFPCQGQFVGVAPYGKRHFGGGGLATG